MARSDTTITTSVSSPRWLAEPSLQENFARFPAKLVAADFTDKDIITIVVGAAGAAGNATSVPIDSFTFPTGITKIPKGTILYFGGEKIAVLTADYTGGASITVAALPNALADNDSAVFKPFGERVSVPSGTLVGRTYAERSAGTGFGPWTSGDNEVYLTVVDVYDAAVNNDVTLLRNQVFVKENYLPRWAALSLVSDWLTALRANYKTLVGKD